MPNLDGPDCAKLIREYEDSNECITPVIIVGITGYSNENIIRDAKRKGMDFVKGKGIGLKELEEIINKFLD